MNAKELFDTELAEGRREDLLFALFYGREDFALLPYHVESVRAMFQDCTRIDATSLNGWNLSPDCDKFDTFANARSYASWY